MMDDKRTTMHTPGPWEVEPRAGRGAWISGPGEDSWAALALGRDDEIATANAHLIAAAPDMLAALKATIDNPGHMLAPNVIFDIREAIAKAEPPR